MERERKRKTERKIVLVLPSFCLLVGMGFFSFMAAADKEEVSRAAGKPLEWSGFTQVQSTMSDEAVDGFQIRRARATIQGGVLNSIRYKLQVDAVRSPVLVDAAVEIDLLPALRLTFGQFKVPFSQENLTSSSALDTIHRSQAVEELCPGRDIGSLGRDIGIALSGKFSRIECILGVFNGSGINRRDTNEKKDLAARLAISPADFLTVAVAHYQGLHSVLPLTPPVDRDRTGVEMRLDRGALTLKGEYIFARDRDTERSGWYLLAAFEVIPEKLQPLLRLDTYDRDLNVQGDRVDVVTMGVNWFFSQKTKLQLNYEYRKDRSAGTAENAILAMFQAGF